MHIENLLRIKKASIFKQSKQNKVMMQTSTFVKVLHILAAVHFATAELEITTKGYEFTQIVHEAELVLPCVVEGEGFDSFIHQLSWYKTDREGNNVLMNSGFTVLEPFDETDRHQIDLERKQIDEKPSVAATLTILDVQLEDNGTYTCKLTHKDTGLLSSVEHSITVQGPIESLTLFVNDTRTDPSTNKTVFDFVALRPSYVSCKSVGGQPQPTVQLFRGDFDITGEFEKKEKVDVTGARGLERAIYETELVSDVFRAEIEDQGEKLKCVARIHHTPKFKQTRSGIMEVTYPPSFDCESYAYAEPGTENYTINCQVKGNPEVHVDSIFWIVGESNGTNITVNDTHKGFTVDITEDEEDKHAVHVSLTISLVNETSYQGYTLRAKNTVGERHYEILLNQPTTTQSTTTTKKPKTKPTKKNGSESGDPKEGAVGSEDDDNGVGIVHCSASILLMILLTGALSW